VNVSIVADEVRSCQVVPEMAFEKKSAKMKNDRMTSSSELEEKLLGTIYMSIAEMAVVPEDMEPVQRWLEKVREGCLNKNSGEEFWSEIIRRGEQLLQEKEPRAMAILQMMPRLYDVDTVTKQCEQILVKLAEDRNSK